VNFQTKTASNSYEMEKLVCKKVIYPNTDFYLYGILPKYWYTGFGFW